MNEVRKTHAESIGARSYVSPLSKVVQFQPEGVVCTSVMILHEGFEMGETYDL